MLLQDLWLWEFSPSEQDPSKNVYPVAPGVDLIRVEQGQLSLCPITCFPCEPEGS